jgi:hypothetical protein
VGCAGHPSKFSFANTGGFSLTVEILLTEYDDTSVWQAVQVHSKKTGSKLSRHASAQVIHDHSDCVCCYGSHFLSINTPCDVNDDDVVQEDVNSIQNVRFESLRELLSTSVTQTTNNNEFFLTIYSNASYRFD